jgi:type IV pilus assembly protein PilM
MRSDGAAMRKLLRDLWSAGSAVPSGAARARTFPIGLHMGTQRMHLVQMQAGPAGRPAIRAAIALDYDGSREHTLSSPARLKALLSTAWKRQPFKGGHVVAAMPKDHVKISLVNYTVADGQSDADAIVRELRERIKGSEEDVVADYMQVRGAELRAQRDAIVAIAQRAEVTRYLDALSDAGLEVDALDIGPSALTRVVSWIPRDTGTDEPPNLLLVTFGATSSFLTVVSGRRLMLDRSVEFAEQRLVARLGAAVDMSPQLATQLLSIHGFAASPASAESQEISSILKEVLRPELAAFAEEVGKTMVYLASKTRGRRIDRIYLIGPIAHYPGMSELLAETLGVAVELLNPFSIYEHALSADALSRLVPHSALGIATGLALRDVSAAWPEST